MVKSFKRFAFKPVIASGCRRGAYLFHKYESKRLLSFQFPRNEMLAHRWITPLPSPPHLVRRYPFIHLDKARLDENTQLAFFVAVVVVFDTKNLSV